MARRFNRDRVLAARVAAAVERGDSPAELVETAGGRLDILTGALATAERGSEMPGWFARSACRQRALDQGGAVETNDPSSRASHCRRCHATRLPIRRSWRSPRFGFHPANRASRATCWIVSRTAPSPTLADLCGRPPLGRERRSSRERRTAGTARSAATWDPTRR